MILVIDRRTARRCITVRHCLNIIQQKTFTSLFFGMNYLVWLLQRKDKQKNRVNPTGSKTRYKLKYYIWGCLALTQIACQSGSFQGQSKKGSAVAETQANAENAGANQSGQPGSESFDLELRESLLDVVWFIDNSGSMSEEAQQVRVNFDRFIDSVADQTNLKVGLVSTDSPVGLSDTSVKLSPEALAKGHKQITTRIGSTNSLAIAAAASCAAADTSLVLSPTDRNLLEYMDTGSKICGIDAFSYTPGFLDQYSENGDWIEQSDSIVGEGSRGSLSDFYREGATQIFVFVTDDDAEAVNEVNFLSGFEQSVPNIKPVVYSFSGLSSSNCDIARVGTAYEALAAATKGKNFDICAPDWTEQFKELGTSVVSKANSKFVLSADPAEGSIEVFLDGVQLNQEAYTVSGKEIVVDEEILRANIDAKLEVTFVHQ